MAGVADACLLTAIVSGGSQTSSPMAFHVAGMQDLAEERSAHVYWVDETPLCAGESLSFALLECTEPSPPIKFIATDSPEYLQEQREFAEFEETHAEPDRPPERLWRALELRLKIKNEEVIAAQAPGWGRSLHVFAYLGQMASGRMPSVCAVVHRRRARRSTQNN